MAWDGQNCLGFVWSMKWGREIIFPNNPDLAAILGDMDFDFDNFICLFFLGFHISKSRSPYFQKSGPGRASVGAGWTLWWSSILAKFRFYNQIGTLCGSVASTIFLSCLIIHSLAPCYAKFSSKVLGIKTLVPRSW